MKKLLTMLLCAAGLLAPVAGAHAFWVNLNSYQEGGADAPLAYIGYGHIFPAAGNLEADELGHYRLIGPDGKVTDLKPNPGGFLVSKLPDDLEAPSMVTSSYMSHIFTMWKENEEMQYKVGTMTGLENVKVSTYYEIYGKALYASDPPMPDAFTKPIGDSFEIVPSVNPSSLQFKEGHDAPKLEVTVLFKGEPAPRAHVKTTYMNYSRSGEFVQELRTDNEGKATIEMRVPGIWMVYAVIIRPVRDEWKDKALEEEYTASMTFALPGKAGDHRGVAH